MRTLYLNRKFSFCIGVLFAMPAILFLFSSLFKYEMGLPALYDWLEPVFAKAGLYEPLGWNINLVIIAGPALAFLLNLLSIAQFNFHFSRQQWEMHLAVNKHWLNIAVLILWSLALACLFFYLVGENLHTSL